MEKEGNALLKIIEEPQPNTVFLLVAQNQDQILNTILSRTQLIKIPVLSYQDIVRYLIDSQHQTEEAAAEIAYLSNGSLTEALTMLGTESKSYHKFFLEWLRMCFANKGLELLPFVEQAAKMGRENQKNFFALWHQLYQGVLHAVIGRRQYCAFTGRRTGNCSKKWLI